MVVEIMIWLRGFLKFRFNKTAVPVFFNDFSNVFTDLQTAKILLVFIINCNEGQTFNAREIFEFFPCFNFSRKSKVAGIVLKNKWDEIR